MHVQQKHVTIVNLHDGQPREFEMSREDRGYRLTAVSDNEIVNVLLSDVDVQKLRREVVKAAGGPAVEECITTERPLGYTLTAADWLSFN
jgi:hypothetical protein